MDSSNPPNGWPHHHRIPKVRGRYRGPPPLQITGGAPPADTRVVADPEPAQRTHEDMERSHRATPGASVHRNHTPFYLGSSSPPSASSTPPRPHPQTSGLHLPPLRNRFVGDGLDFRQPAMSTPAPPTNAPPADVIDLTSEDEPSVFTAARPAAPQMQSTRATRPPRFAREIIDLSDDTPSHGPPADAAANAAPSSPEVQFVSSRTIPGRRPPQQQSPAVDLTEDDDEFFDVVFGDFEARHGVNRGPPGDGGFRTRSQRNSPALHRRFMHILGERTSVRGHRNTERRQRRTGEGSQRLRHGAPYLRQLIGGDPDGLLEIHAQGPLMNFMGPGAMNYAVAAFDLGGEREPSPATYDAPPKPPSGFTRSPQEDDVLVCPNCDAELCMGPEGAEKRQVWIIKACGHVSCPNCTSRTHVGVSNKQQAYCGECANNRHASKRKGKEPAGSTNNRLPQPFQKCVVKDCGKKCTARTAMIQLFL